jgi:hypothetical protein
MSIKQELLLQELLSISKENQKRVSLLQTLNHEQLNFKANDNSWSILECLEHLNLYGDYYLPNITKALQNTKKAPSIPYFTSGWLGNYFVNAIKIENKEKINKMSCPDDKKPNQSTTDKSTIERFFIQQEKLVQLLEIAKEYDLNKVKIKISISKWIKISLGDTFRFYIYHIQRHIAQAEKALVNR